MEDAISVAAPRSGRLSRTLRDARDYSPTRVETGLALLSAALLILSFPDHNLWPLAWVGLVPVLVAVARRAESGAGFVLGWLTGVLFFYGSCYWLTYSMMRYGHLPPLIAYLLLFIPVVIVSLFPAMCMAVLARAVRRWGARALFAAPFLWAALEWARLGLTGQLWNAIGYSQAYHPALIQTARWGGVYLVGFLILLVNAAVAFLVLKRSMRAMLLTLSVMMGVSLFIFLIDASSNSENIYTKSSGKPDAIVVAVQPNVPMDPVDSEAEAKALVDRHLSLSESALGELDRKGLQGIADVQRIADDEARGDASTVRRADMANLPRVVIWPESPMNFTYARDAEFRELVARFAAKNHTSVIFNSLEPAPLGGAYNAAVMVNEEGRLVAQYDKIRLLPFGEYVPVPRWLPGANLLPVMVGDFTPGAEYTLMPVGEARAGVFICFESAFPSIARRFAYEGADVLINISNDGYLGPTPVMRQHLANVVFRAVENDRPILRVTNTGISAYINARGEVSDATAGFQTEVRTWTVNRAPAGQTFYTRHGDLFAGLCALLSSLLIVSLPLSKRKTDND
jgi:apolipoprotein N-acyltransferase